MNDIAVRGWQANKARQSTNEAQRKRIRQLESELGLASRVIDKLEKENARLKKKLDQANDLSPFTVCHDPG
jgi:predicted nuclease with TOPRIM domain